MDAKLTERFVKRCHTCTRVEKNTRGGSDVMRDLESLRMRSEGQGAGSGDRRQEVMMPFLELLSTLKVVHISAEEEGNLL